ncbi:TPA: thiol peroxidase [Vibrio vulnificus]
MNNVDILGHSRTLQGEFPRRGQKAKSFNLISSHLSVISNTSILEDFILICTYPSLDTYVCASGIKQFNKLAKKHKNVKVICVSSDLPFACARFEKSHDISNAIIASTIHSATFSLDYGVKIPSGIFKNLSARSVVLLKKDLTVIYSQLASKITDEIDYSELDSELASCSIVIF